MMLRFTALLALGLSVAANAQHLSVDEIVQRHLQARGGEARLKALHSVVYSRGTYREPGYQGSGNAYMAMARPFYKLVGDPADTSATFREGYDGSAWEWYRNPGFVVRTVGAANAAARHNLDPEGPFFDYRAKGSSIERGKDAVIGGRPAYGLIVRLRDGFEQLYFLDKETFLISASRQSSSIHAFGEAVAREERYADHRRVDGILFPFRFVETEIATGAELSAMEWGSIEVNRDIPRAYFSPPSFVRSPLQAVLEQLYYQRSDTAALKWTYFAFRRAYPAIDARAGMKAIGFQMLKMGDQGGAIALLAANLADHPQSSSAAFSLGRAYLSVADTALARSALTQALRLDPANKRALDALAGMDAVKHPR